MIKKQKEFGSRLKDSFILFFLTTFQLTGFFSLGIENKTINRKDLEWGRKWQIQSWFTKPAEELRTRFYSPATDTVGKHQNSEPGEACLGFSTPSISVKQVQWMPLILWDLVYISLNDECYLLMRKLFWAVVTHVLHVCVSGKSYLHPTRYRINHCTLW